MFGHNSPLLTVSMVINTPPRKNPVKPLSTLPNIEEHNEPEPAPSAPAQKQPHTGNPVIDSLIDSDSPEPPTEPKQPAAPKEGAEPALTTQPKPRSVTEELRSSVVSCDLAVEEATGKKEEPEKKESGKPSLGLPADCLESTCEFDPVESDRKDDEVSAKKESGKHSFGLPADCMMSTGEFDPVESDRRDDEPPTRFEPIKEEDESDELPVEKKEEPVKKESGKHSFGLPADCLKSTCEFDPVESDRRDDETPVKKETPKSSFGLPADCMMSTGEFDPVESDRRDDEPTRFEPIREEDESDELPVEKKEEPAVKKETPKHSFGLPADCLESTCEFDPVESDRKDDEVSVKKESGKHSFGLPADCMMSTGEFDPVESDRRDDEPTRFEPIKEEDESDNETPVKKEEPAVKKESGKPSLGLPTDCLESTCEFDPVESDRRDDEPPKKESGKHSFGLPADCMMSTGEFDPVESDRRDDEPPTRFEPIKEEDESDELPVEKKEEPEKKDPEKKESGKHSFGFPADCLESTCEFDPVESDRRDDETPVKKETPKSSFGLPADCMMSTGEFDPVESDRRDDEPTRFEPIKEEDESDDETPVKKEEPVEKKESGKPSLGLPADCLESTCEFDPVESDRKDDEVSAKKETPKHSFGLPADCMMSTGEFDPVESDRRDDEPPTRFEPIKEEDESDELPTDKKETPALQRNESVKSTGEFDPVESNREEIPLPPPAVGATQISDAAPAKSARSSGEFDPVESERKDETPASKNPAELTDTVVFSRIPENPAVSVEEVAPAAAPLAPVIPAPLEVTIPSAEENSAELLRMTNSGQNLGGLQFTEETPEEPLVASKVTAIKRKDELEKEEGAVGRDNSIPEKKNSPLDETTVIQLDPDLLNEELEQAGEEEEEEYEERRGCWGCRN